jgi:hypothetical protein
LKLDSEDDQSAKKQVRQLLFVIFFGIALAAIGTFWMAYHYGPSGRYVVNYVLLSPETIPQLSYNDYDPKTNGYARFVFNKIEFTYYDDAQASWQKTLISNDRYKYFYDLISNEKSVAQLSDDIVNSFNQSTSSHLVLTVRTESSAQWQSTEKNFQEVQFIKNGHYFRIGLHEDAAKTQWAYFYHPDIYEEVLHLFLG